MACLAPATGRFKNIATFISAVFSHHGMCWKSYNECRELMPLNGTTECDASARAGVCQFHRKEFCWWCVLLILT